MPTERRRLWFKFLLLSLVWGWLLWLGGCSEPAELFVEHETVELPGWPADAAPARIAIIGDIHATKYDGAKLDAYISTILSAEPEAVLLLGDCLFTTGKFRFAMDAGEFARHIAPLVQHCPVYYVAGNHDLFPETRCVLQELKKAGCIPIDTRWDHLHVFRNGQGVRLRGAPFIPEKEDARRLRSQFSPSRGKYRDRPLLSVVHNPYHFLKWKLAGDLVLSGHTHGGQICMPDQRPFLPGGIPPRWQRAGWHKTATGAPLYITRGTGMTKLPFRFNCPPQITILELRGEGGIDNLQVTNDNL